ncbi:alpha/beta hydrolase [Streptomyces physcomitrii]|uniref:alpha/beta fold hydrolase n=1 Tax=Streptomyces physcomitrii TaxID=2724184 RepID=UPI003408820F
MEHVVSADGTAIAYERKGEGPPLVLLGGGFRDHHIFDSIVSELEANFTTFAYDRRGRGESGDAEKYAVEREVEDLAAVMEAAGGEPFVFGGSSGALLTLEAAMVGAPMRKLALLEPPYRVAGHVGPPPGFAERLDSLLEQGRHGDAAEMFLLELVGFTPEMVEEWKNSPMWAANEAVAHTLPYDTAVCGDGRLPVERLARTQVETLVVSSTQTGDWLRAASQETAKALGRGRHLELPGVWHRVPPEVLCPALIEFYTD